MRMKMTRPGRMMMRQGRMRRRMRRGRMRKKKRYVAHERSAIATGSEIGNDHCAIVGAAGRETENGNENNSQTKPGREIESGKENGKETEQERETENGRENGRETENGIGKRKLHTDRKTYLNERMAMP